MNAKLINELTGEEYPVSGVCLIGRTSESNVQIADPRISRRHAMIRQQPDGFWYFDLGSFNGSYVNGARVTASRKLQDGDRVGLGDYSFRYEQVGVGTELPVDDLDAAATIGEVRTGEAILLVSDIQGYTTLSERLPPDQLAPIIGGWYSETERILTQYGATLDKFIGDCVLAYWTDTSIPARLQACQTVGAMVRNAEETREKHKDILEGAGLTFLSGAALHKGRVAYGGLSSQEYTLLGDPVNLAFRLEALTRSLGAPVVVSGEFLDGWPAGNEACKNLGFHEVKGRQQPVEVFSLQNIPQ